MTGIATFPDIEAMLSAYLRQAAPVTDLVGQRVYTRIPRQPEWPLVRLWRIGGAPVYSQPLVLDAPLVQFDAWGGSAAQARTLAATVLTVLSQFPSDVPGITGIAFGPFVADEDASYDRPKPRYRFDATIWVRIGAPTS